MPPDEVSDQLPVQLSSSLRTGAGLSAGRFECEITLAAQLQQANTGRDTHGGGHVARRSGLRGAVGVSLDTPAYMAPELAIGDHVDERADI